MCAVRAGSQHSRRSGGSEASTARGHVAREVVVPQPSRDEFVRFYVNFFKLHAKHSRESCLREGDGRNFAMTACPFRSLVSHTMPRPKEPFHLLADRTRRRRLQELQEVVTKELAAPYTVKYLPDTGQIVLTPEARIVATVQPEPT